MRLAITLFVAALVGAERPEASQAPQIPGPQAPIFRSSVEVTTLDVTVIDIDGRPVVDLRPAELTVRIDGKPRRVVRVEWIPLARPSSSPPAPPPPDGYSTNESSTGGRLIVIAIDQPNIRSDGTMGLRATVNAFLDHLEPSDRVAAIALGFGVSTPFTTNRATVKEAISRMTGDMRLISELGVYSLSASEALEITDGNQATLQTAVTRECFTSSVRADPACPFQIVGDAQVIAASLQQETERTLSALYGLLDTLKKIEAPKTLVLVSEGFTMTSPSGVTALGSIAAASRTSVYALKLDDRIFDAATRRPPPPGVGDRQLRFAGLETLASASKGGVFEVIGAGSAAFERLEREISGYYLIGVESMPADTDGKAHPINVQVGRKGTVVRARRELADVAVARANATNPLEVVAAALSSPLITPALPLHVATFSLRDRDPSKIQVLIHADIGSDYTSATSVTLGYVISDSSGTIVEHQVGDGRLAPPGNFPAPLPYTVSASLEPGEYTLKIAVTEGGRVGSVEHPVHAGLIDAGSLKLSELMIGGPVDAKELLRPTISYDINFGGVQGYMEAYGTAGSLLMRYEVAPTADAPAVLSAVVPGRPAEEGRTVFSYIVPVRELPAGQYVLRATLSSGSSYGTPLKKVARAFRVLDARPGATAVNGARVTPAPPSTAPAVTVMPARPFRRDDVVRGGTLQQFRDIVAPAARQDFDAGVTFLTAGDFVKAEQSFKSAQRATPVADNGTAPLTYLAATYAASGHDLEATSVWQTALIDGYEYAQIYEWLADAFIRIRNFDQARSLLKEATEKWPNDSRFSIGLTALPPPPVGR